MGTEPKKTHAELRKEGNTGGMQKTQADCDACGVQENITEHGKENTIGA